jgi:Trypsin
MHGTTSNVQIILTKVLFVATRFAQNPLKMPFAKYDILTYLLPKSEIQIYFISNLQGDSGGPAIIYESDGRPTLAGFSSFVAAMGCSGYPNAFVRVENFLSWILLYIEGHYEDRNY